MKATHHRDSEFPPEKEWLCWRRPCHCCGGSPALRDERTTSPCHGLSVACSLPLWPHRLCSVCGQALLHFANVQVESQQTWARSETEAHWHNATRPPPPSHPGSKPLPHSCSRKPGGQNRASFLERTKDTEGFRVFNFPFKWGDAGCGSSAGTFGRKHVWLFATLWTPVCQAPLSLGFSRQDYWGG